MFLIRNVDGLTRPYQVGEIRRRRALEPAAAVSEVASSDRAPVDHSELPTSGRNSTHTHSAAQRYQSSEQNQTTRKELGRASDIMTSPVLSISVSTSMDEAQHIFATHRFRHLPVLSEAGHLAGLLSDRDVLRFQLKLLESRRSHDANIPVSKIMVTDVLTATPNTAIRDVARILFAERIGSMPIMDESSNVQGIITRSDILRALINHGPIQLWA